MEQNVLYRGVTALLAMLLSTPAQAQMPDPQAGPRPVPPVMEELDRMTEQRERAPIEMEESARHFEAKKRERLMKILQLDEATRATFSQRLEQLDQKGEDLRRQRREAFQALREQAKGLRKENRRGQREGGRRGPDEAPAAGAPVDEGALRQALERVYAVEDAMAGLRRERLQIGRDLLTPEQQVKLLLFTIRFQKEMRERLQREHGRERGSQDRPRRFEGGLERERP
jgi:hypothetical protein